MCECEKFTGKHCAKKVSIFSTLQDEQVREIVYYKFQLTDLVEEKVILF